MLKKLTISHTEEGKINVEFIGLWSRRDVERANVSMLRALTGHIAKEKEKMAKPVAVQAQVIKEVQKIKEGE